MPTNVFHHDGDMLYEYVLTEKGIQQWSHFNVYTRSYDCTFKFDEDSEIIQRLPIPELWKIKKIDLFGFLFESRFADDDKWNQIQILRRGLT